MARNFSIGLAAGALSVMAWHFASVTDNAAPTAGLNEPANTPVAACPDATAATSLTPASLNDTEAASSQSNAGANVLRNGVFVDRSRNTLSVSRRDSSLRSILDEITQQSGIDIRNVAIAQNSTQSVELENVTLESGLRTLLAGHDAFFYYTSNDSHATLQTVWLYALGQGNGLAPMNERDTTAIAAADEVDNAGVDELLHKAVDDADADKRFEALAKMTQTGVVPPRDWLEQVLQTDRSATMRLEAFRLLTQMPELKPDDLRAIANQALSDPDDGLRQEAQQLLGDMNVAAANATSTEQATLAQQ